MIKYHDINCPDRRLKKENSDICRLLGFLFLYQLKKCGWKYNCTEKFGKYKIKNIDLILILGKIDSVIIEFGVYRKKKRVLRNCSFRKKKCLWSGLVGKTGISFYDISAMKLK